MFGLGAGEIAVIVVLAVILWGPDKLPELAKKAARLIRFFRQVANDAQVTVRNELGPGFEDFDITDPKGSVRRYVMKQGGLDGVQDLVQTLREASDELDEAAADFRRTIDTDGDGVISPDEAEAAGLTLPGAPFDSEAT
ncbi:Sec-independent protein translocase subunit TatB [Raineyella sp. LH-20]|uniref:Sec-independent protein translocase subunit TatB n=1 Tax=Raineyella sp. LH-20 TaxID=3081204 RepID=UPI0029549349|nr:Sec-independent protein translocase subunit TatB [Raineyella sp. LH-20]WOP17554.1 Sec-independent protein translocase subunit TatB [Raineyella sp. LH-20]